MRWGALDWEELSGPKSPSQFFIPKAGFSLLVSRPPPNWLLGNRNITKTRHSWIMSCLQLLIYSSKLDTCLPFFRKVLSFGFFFILEDFGFLKTIQNASAIILSKQLLEPWLWYLHMGLGNMSLLEFQFHKNSMLYICTNPKAPTSNVLRQNDQEDSLPQVNTYIEIQKEASNTFSVFKYLLNLFNMWGNTP